MKICREAKKKFEKSIVEKCKDQPKLFYKYVNGKLKNRKEIVKLKVDNIIYEDPLMIYTGIRNTEPHW